jgi:hypothetical protein
MLQDSSDMTPCSTFATSSLKQTLNLISRADTLPTKPQGALWAINYGNKQLQNAVFHSFSLLSAISKNMTYQHMTITQLAKCRLLNSNSSMPVSRSVPDILFLHDPIPYSDLDIGHYLSLLSLPSFLDKLNELRYNKLIVSMVFDLFYC